MCVRVCVYLNRFYNANSFGHDISRWNVAKVANVEGCFFGTSLPDATKQAMFDAWGGTLRLVYPTWGGQVQAGAAISDASIRVMFAEWGANETAAVASYGPISGWDTSGVTNMYRLGSLHPTFVSDISSWNVASVANMRGLFAHAGAFNGDLSKWNTACVTTMVDAFSGASAFNSNVANWNTASVTSMGGIFANAGAFNADLSKWNVGRVANLANFFNGAKSFNADISAWNVASVTGPLTRDLMGGMAYAFCGAMAFNGDLSGWNTAGVTDMRSTFASASAFTGENIGGWNVCSVTLLTSTFQGTSAFSADIGAWNVGRVTSLYLTFASASSFRGNLSGWNTARVVQIAGAFDGASMFNANIGGWNVASVSNMDSAFASAAAFAQDISGWSVQSVTTLANIFAATALPDALKRRLYDSWGSTLRAAYPTWAQMQSNAEALMDASIKAAAADVASGPGVSTLTARYGPISTWDTSRVTDFSQLFYNKPTFNADISKWNTANVTTMRGMLSGATAFVQDISGWNVGRVLDMRDTFALVPLPDAVKSRLYSSWGGLLQAVYPTWGQLGMTDASLRTAVTAWITNAATASATYGPIAAWDTSRVTNMGQLFSNQKMFTGGSDADISRWNTASVANAAQMFLNTVSTLLCECSEYPIGSTPARVSTVSAQADARRRSGRSCRHSEGTWQTGTSREWSRWRRCSQAHRSSTAIFRDGTLRVSPTCPR
jgi:surface protein